MIAIDLDGIHFDFPDPLKIIVAGRRNFLMQTELESEGVTQGDMEDLLDQEMVERWDRPDGPAWTLSPLGAERLEVEIRERFQIEEENFVIVGYWAPIERPDRTVKRKGNRGGVRATRFSQHEFCFHPLYFPEFVALEELSPEYLLDEVTEIPIRFFSERRLMAEIDHRLKGKR